MKFPHVVLCAFRSAFKRIISLEREREVLFTFFILHLEYWNDGQRVNIFEQNQLNRLQIVQFECPKYRNPCVPFTATWSELMSSFKQFIICLSACKGSECNAVTYFHDRFGKSPWGIYISIMLAFNCEAVSKSNIIVYIFLEVNIDLIVSLCLVSNNLFYALTTQLSNNEYPFSFARRIAIKEIRGSVYSVD